MFKLDLEKAEEPEIKLSTSAGSSKKQESSRKNIYFSFINYVKAFDCGDHKKLWEILKEMGIPDHLTCLLWNLYAGQEATVRTGHGTTDCFQIGKGVRQGCILSPCLFNFYAEYIMKIAGLDEAQAGIKIAGRNISHLRYADDTTLMAEIEEELKSLLRVWVKSLSRVRLFATPWTVAYQASLSMGFCSQEYWSGLPFPFPGDLPDPGVEPRSPALEAYTLTAEPPGKPVDSQRIL